MHKIAVITLLLISVPSCKKWEKNPATTEYIIDESYLYDQSPAINKDSLVIMQWNIGHFAKGSSLYSTINQEEIESVAYEWKSVLYLYSPDILSLNEYSASMGTYADVSYYARDILFHDYPYAYIGRQNNYSCNAIFAKVQLQEVRYNKFECNQNATITHTDSIQADEYYFISSLFYWQDKVINLVTTHLAFDNNDASIVRAQITELINKYDDCDYVIMCGDWNTSRESYQIFEDSGYEILNCGDFGDLITAPLVSMCLDNIVVKGLTLKNVAVLETDLSDHYPIMCTIRLKEN